MQGKPFELTDQVRATIIKAASRGLLQKDIARAIGLKNQTHFINVIKKNFPEIDELIEEGRALLRDKMLSLSEHIITDKRDPARAQEIHRLHRIARTEEPESGSVDVNGKAVTQITFSVIEKPAEPKAE